MKEGKEGKGPCTIESREPKLLYEKGSRVLECKERGEGLLDSVSIVHSFLERKEGRKKDRKKERQNKEQCAFFKKEAKEHTATHTRQVYHSVEQRQLIQIIPTFLPPHPQTTYIHTMGCTPSRPRLDKNGPSTPHTNNTSKKYLHHGPKYPQVPPGHLPHDCATCTHANRKFEQKCGDACTATRRSNMRCKWDPDAHPRRHSWEVYDEETVW